MNKGKNCFFAILVFGLTMAVFNGMSVVLAVSASIGGGIIQGANGVNMTYDYLMDHMNFYSVLVYLIPLAIFGLWYYFAFVDQKGTENSLSVKIKKLDITGCLILVIFTFFNPACDESGDGSNQPVISTGNGNLYGND